MALQEDNTDTVQLLVELFHQECRRHHQVLAAQARHTARQTRFMHLLINTVHMEAMKDTFNGITPDRTRRITMPERCTTMIHRVQRCIQCQRLCILSNHCKWHSRFPVCQMFHSQPAHQWHRQHQVHHRLRRRRRFRHRHRSKLTHAFPKSSVTIQQFSRSQFAQSSRLLLRQRKESQGGRFNRQYEQGNVVRCSTK